jgi:hypothetical protein
MTDAGATGGRGQIVFVEERQPPLPAGDFAVTVRQQLRTTDEVVRTEAQVVEEDDAHETTRRLSVRGERFALDPGELLAVFPPAENSGEYATVLPHVVFSRATLPWERSADDTGTTSSTWLALLLFDEPGAPPPRRVTVADLSRDGDLPDAAVSYPDASAFRLDHGESWTDTCTVIDVPVELFAAIAPSLADLRWLAHVRQVDTSAKTATQDGTAAAQENAVLVGNRLPAPDSRCVVHLVSLEGMAPFLRPTGAGAPPALQAAPGVPATCVRLVSLASWGFVSADPRRTFGGYLESVDVGPLRPPVPAEPTLCNAFTAGFTALPHHGADGERTVSWHRGPLVPGPVQPDPTVGATPAATADELVRHDPARGLADVSWAVAWELGRLLALASPAFSRALYRYKRDLVSAGAGRVPVLPLMRSAAFLDVLPHLVLPR